MDSAADFHFRRSTEAFVNWHLDKGYVNRLPDKPTLADYEAVLSADRVAAIIELEVEKTISHKSAVFLAHYYMVLQWIRDNIPEEQRKSYIASHETSAVVREA